MSLTFVRHAQSIGNTVSIEERAGWEIPNHAYPLTNIGENQAIMAGLYLKTKFGSDFFQTCFDSDFIRSSMTLTYILNSLDQQRVVRLTDSRLNEKWDGIFHELSPSELQAQYPEQIALRKRTGYYLHRAPGGENCPDVELRIRSFLGEYLQLAMGTNVLIVGHGRWFLIFQKLFHNWTVARFLEEKEKERCENCSVSHYSNDALRDRALPTFNVPWAGKLQCGVSVNA